MKKNEFIKLLKKQLDIEEEIKENSNIKAILDSFSIMELISFVDIKFDKKLSFNDLKSMNTINDLINFIDNDRIVNYEK